MDDENAYQALMATDSDGDARWAFGTGFDDPLAGIDRTVPDGVDGQELGAYAVMLGDDALVLSQRLTQWVTWAPELEEELALANIALDLLGQARLLLSRAGHVDGSQRGEDAFAYFRNEREFRNVRLVEFPDQDFADTIARLTVFSSWRLALFTRLRESCDPVLSAIAAKGVKELTYHRDYAARWLVRLGDGTGESHRRMTRGVRTVWPLREELFIDHEVERRMAEHGIGVLPSQLRAKVDEVVAQVLRAAGVDEPEPRTLSGVSGQAGRDGIHSEHLGFLLAEMQSLAREEPDASW